MKFCPVTLEDVASLDNLCAAWEEFIRGKRNKEDVQAFTRNLADEIMSLHEDLLSGAFRHGPYIHFRICDPKPRDIHKASVRDRLLHHAIHRQLYPFHDRLFISDSFSCRTGKGVHAALDRFRSMARKTSKNLTRTCWVLKCDIRKFFASIDHEALLKILTERMTDKRLIDLIARIVESFEIAPGKGIPLGNLTSQLFANIYMNELDHFVKQFIRAHGYIRYADDFVILSDDRAYLCSLIPLIRLFLHERLQLELHPKKVSITTFASGMDFLGWIHFPHHRIPRTKTKNRMFKRIWMNPANESLQSYLGCLSHGDAHEARMELMNVGWLMSGVEAEKSQLDASMLWVYLKINLNIIYGSHRRTQRIP